eukprot:tig00000624_g2644.t1
MIRLRRLAAVDWRSPRNVLRLHHWRRRGGTAHCERGQRNGGWEKTVKEAKDAQMKVRAFWAHDRGEAHPMIPRIIFAL